MFSSSRRPTKTSSRPGVATMVKPPKKTETSSRFAALVFEAAHGVHRTRASDGRAPPGARSSRFAVPHRAPIGLRTVQGGFSTAKPREEGNWWAKQAWEEAKPNRRGCRGHRPLNSGLRSPYARSDRTLLGASRTSPRTERSNACLVVWS